MNVSKLKVNNETFDIKDTTARSDIGDKAGLTTTSKTSLVSAVNEHQSELETLIDNDTGKSIRQIAQEVTSTLYVPKGSVTFENLPSLALETTKIGYVYNVTNAFSTTSDFIEGAGVLVGAGTNVVVADAGDSTKKWDLLGQTVDLSPYQQKTMTNAVTIDGTSRTTVETAISALNNYADKKSEQYSIMPTAQASIVGKIVQYIGTTTSTYTNGLFYKCILDTNNNYIWEEIKFGSNMFTGTSTEWNQLSTLEKANYELVSFTDDPASGDIVVSDTVTNGDMNPVSSNAVYSALDMLLNDTSRTLTSDLNTCVKSGTYAFNVNTQNAPEGYGVCIVIGQSTNVASNSHQWIWQLALGTSGSYLYLRRCINPNTTNPSNSVLWSSWELLQIGTFTTISNPITRDTTHTSSMDEITAVKQGKIAMLQCHLQFSSITENTWNYIGIVQDSLKPINNTYMTITEGITGQFIALVQLFTDGHLAVWGQSNLNTLCCRLSATYFTAN